MQPYTLAHGVNDCQSLQIEETRVCEGHSASAAHSIRAVKLRYVVSKS